MTIVQEIKTALGWSHNKLDDDLETTVQAAKQRLRMVGVREIEEDDALTREALKLYAKGKYNYQGDGPRYMDAFGRLADAMSLSGDYNGGGDDE